MQYPLLSEIQTVREVIDTFGGYNHNPRIGEAEFYDMENMTSSFYPTISSRKTRGEYVSAEGYYRQGYAVLYRRCEFCRG